MDKRKKYFRAVAVALLLIAAQRIWKNLRPCVSDAGGQDDRR